MKVYCLLFQYYGEHDELIGIYRNREDAERRRKEEEEIVRPIMWWIKEMEIQ